MEKLAGHRRHGDDSPQWAKGLSMGNFRGFGNAPGGGSVVTRGGIALIGLRTSAYWIPDPSPGSLDDCRGYFHRAGCPYEESIRPSSSNIRSRETRS